MKSTNDPWADALAAIAEEEAGDQHPRLAELVDYHEKKLPSERREEIQDHLALCASCADAVLDLGAFPEVEAHSEVEIDSDAQEEDWQVLQKQLRLPSPPLPFKRPPVEATAPEAYAASTAPEAYAASTAPEVYTASTAPEAYASGLPRALAAIFFIGCFGLSLWVYSLSTTIDRLSAVAANAQIGFLYPEENVERSATPPNAENDQIVRLRRGQERYTLSLIPVRGDLGSYTSYRADIIRLSDGKTVARIDGLEPNRQAFNVGLSRGSLASGDYRIELFGLKTAEQTLLGTFPVSIEVE